MDQKGPYGDRGELGAGSRRPTYAIFVHLKEEVATEFDVCRTTPGHTIAFAPEILTSTLGNVCVCSCSWPDLLLCAEKLQP